ncbi:MAG: hypothetical protein ACM3KM_02695 [Acidobacteriaceae bacterium]
MGITDQTPVEYFKQRVETALENQQIETEETVSFYLVNLLCNFLNYSKGLKPQDPFGVEYFKAAGLPEGERQARLRVVGDSSLFLVGYFLDSLHGKMVGPDYFAAIGSSAYRTLASDLAWDEDSSETFQELGDRFEDFALVLNEVNEADMPRSCTDLLKLYERWLRTGSPAAFRQLVSQGITPQTFQTRKLQ